MDLLKKELILLRNGHIRIFRCKARNLSTRPRKLHQNYAVQDQRKVSFYCNERFRNLNCINTFDVIRRFLCNTKTNFDASNGEPLPCAVRTFQECLRDEMNLVKLKLEQVKKWAIEKDGCLRLRIEDINGNRIKFVLNQVILQILNYIFLRNYEFYK